MVVGRRLQYLVASAVSLATATLGMSSVWSTPVIHKLQNNETNIEMSDNQVSWMLSLSPVGFMFGSLVTRFLCDRFGRRSTLLFSALPIATGTIIAATVNQAWMLLVMKLMWGFGTGMISMVVTIYIAEIADKEIRGRLSVGTRFMFNFGGLLMMCIGAYATYEVMNYSLLVMPVLYFTACLCIPESPYYYLKEGKEDAAKKELLRLRGREDGLEEELESMKCHVQREMRNSSSTIELFRGRQYRKAIIIVFGLKFAQIMTGTQTVQQYLTVIMKESKINMAVPTMMIIYGAVKFIVGVMSSFLADRVGRRPLLIYSFFGYSVSSAIIGFYFLSLEVLSIDHDSLRPYSFVTFFCILASNVVSTIGFNSIMGVVQGEAFPLNVKAVAITVLNIYGGVLGFLVTKLFKKIKDLSGLCGVFWVYASIALVGSIFAYITVPETKGKSLREIQAMLQGEVYYANGEELKTMNDKRVENDDRNRGDEEVMASGERKSLQSANA
ncbi:facilitated trehalose transporter Tret1-like [Colias croceus]|uniref:facilitated trehalose transporter Tret1-like n=1 Tax=Colias crocea TaxID=72248 RepID=UPI001E27DE6D|nr:facilitated trehalose transporter Tret1-like [Colias croceus]